MSEPGNFDGIKEGNVDPYTTESSADIYTTPEVSLGTTDVVLDEVSAEVPAVPVTDTHGLFSGSGQQMDPYGGQMNTPYGGQPGDPYGSQPNVSYSGQPGNPYGGQPNVPYSGQAGDPYGSQPSVPYSGQAGDSYGSQPSVPYSGQAGNPYGSQPNVLYGGQSGDPYGSQPNVPYSGQPGDPYGGQSYDPYGGTNNNPYYNNYQDVSSYGSNPYGGQQFGGGSGGQPPFNNNPYSPYAVPQKKGHTGLIITIVVIIILLFIVAICALAYRAVQLVNESDYDVYENEYSDRYDFDDDYEYHNDYDDDFYGYDDDDDFFYGDDYDYDDDRYYSLQDDIKYDLSYEVEFEYYEYDTDDEDVSILVTYPVISGEDVPNLDTLNDAIYSEVREITEYYEEEYLPYMDKNEDSYFSATSIGYVTYMDEDKLSIVFQEHIYADTYLLAYLECINIDMESGVILDNEEMLSIDDSFSVEFRTRSDEQNGEIYYLTNMTDQEITGYFKSSDVIVFYTPKGMEIGFNYEDGWVTVTYEEYEQYLNVF